jgi:hypothetical protein
VFTLQSLAVTLIAPDILPVPCAFVSSVNANVPFSVPPAEHAAFNAIDTFGIPAADCVALDRADVGVGDPAARAISLKSAEATLRASVGDKDACCGLVLSPHAAPKTTSRAKTLERGRFDLRM